MKRRIRLTESDLHKVIKESVYKTLNEITRRIEEDNFSKDMDSLYNLLKDEIGNLNEYLFYSMGDIKFDNDDDEAYTIIYTYSDSGMLNLLYNLVNYDLVCITPNKLDIKNSNHPEVAKIISKYVKPDMITRVYDEFC
jgi:hypothetical protein